MSIRYQSRLLGISVLLPIASIILSCDESKNLVSCDDDSGRWKAFPSSLNIESDKLFFIDEDRGWAVGNEGRVATTVDGGRTWAKQNSGVTCDLRSVFFIDERNGWASGVDHRILRTTDGGLSWYPQEIESDSATILASIHFNDAGIGWLISYYGDIYCSLDSGNSWTLKHTFNEWGYTYLFFPTKDVGLAMSIARNEFRKTTDGGNSWEIRPMPTQFTTDVYFIDEDRGWVTENWAPSSMMHDSVSVHRTFDGGKTWQSQAALPGLAMDNIVFTDHQNGWMSDATSIYHTTDGGESWYRQFEAEDMGFIEDVFFINEVHGWALTSDGYTLRYSCH